MAMPVFDPTQPFEEATNNTPSFDPGQPFIDASSIVKPGNIDLNNRPVVKNPDGSISTVRSKSFNFDGVETLLPTVSEDGRIISDQEAVNQFKATGKHLGQFTSPEAATAYAQQLHEDQAKKYGAVPTLDPSQPIQDMTPNRSLATAFENQRPVPTNSEELGAQNFKDQQVAQTIMPVQKPYDPGSLPLNDPRRVAIGPDTRSPIRKATDYIASKLEPLTFKNRAFPLVSAADVASGNFRTLLPGVDQETGASTHSTATPEENAAAPVWAKVTAGLERAGAGTAEAVIPWTLTGGVGAGLAKAPLLARGISAAFAADMISNFPSTAKTFIKAVNDGDIQTAVESGVSVPLSAYFSYKAAEHSLAPGIAAESPAIRSFLTTKIAQEYTPEEIRDIYGKVDRGVANPAQEELVKFINTAIDKPGEAVRKGVTITTSQPAMESQFWRDYLGLKPGETTITTGISGTLKPKQATTTGAQNAADQIPKQIGVQPERVGTDEVGQTVAEAGGSDRLPSAIGESPKTEVTAPKFDATQPFVEAGAVTPPVTPAVTQTPEEADLAIKNKIRTDRIATGIIPKNIQVTVNTDPSVPGWGYVQVDELDHSKPEGQKNIFSSNPEAMIKDGYQMPTSKELMQLPKGQYTLPEAIQKLDDLKTAAPQAPAPTPIPIQQTIAPTTAPAAEVKPENAVGNGSDKGVRDMPQSATVSNGVVKIVSRVGRRVAGETITFPVSDWVQAHKFANPNFTKSKLIEKLTPDLDDQPGGAGQAQRIRDSMVKAVENAFKTAGVSFPEQGWMTRPAAPVAKPAEKPTIKESDVNQPTESRSGGSGAGGQQPATPLPTGEERPAGAAPAGPGPSVQPGIREANERPAAVGGSGSGGRANADVVRVPGEQGSTTAIPAAEPTGTVTPDEVRSQPSEANPAPDPEVVEPSRAGEPVESRPKNIRLSENPAPTGAVARIKANIDALALVKKLESEDRFPTDEERKTLAMWSGWGSFKELFNEGRAERRDWDAGWMKKYGSAFDKLKKLMSVDEFNAAAESSVNAHYTSQDAVTAMWDLVRRLGYVGGRALEPSTGSGVFIGYAPADLAGKTRWTGAEMEPITGKIFSYLYPEVDMRIQPFENTKIPNGFYDLAMTNVPFHETGPGKEYPDLNLHNYFIARMLDKVRPGGLVVVITTHNTMDAAPEQRALLIGKGQLVGAIRLPSNAFKESAATEVVTDILVLRKSDGKPFNASKWTNVTKVDTNEGEAVINEFFVNNPEMVLGRNALTGTMYKKDSYTVEPTAGSISEKLAAAISKFPENIMQPEQVSTAPVDQTQLEEGTLVMDAKGHVLEARNFQLYPAAFGSPSLLKRARIYIGLRDVLKRQYVMEDDAKATDAEIESNRAKLREAYQAMVKELDGTVNQNDRKMGFLSGDPDFYTVMGIEVFREVQDPKDPNSTVTVAEPADVLTKRVKQPDVPPDKAENATDGLGVSLAYKGSFDMDYVKQLTGLNEEQIEAELIANDLAFKDPESGKVVTAQDYLTGEIREKLAKAIFAAKESPTFDRNVEALKRVIPENVPFDKIRLGITARWVPPVILNRFAAEVIGLTGDEIFFVPVIEEFAVKPSRGHRLSEKAMTQWSTKNMNALELLRYALNFKRAKIMVEVEKGKYREDSAASALNNQVIDNMGKEFAQWVRTTDIKVPYRYFDADRGEYNQAELSVWDVLEREFNRTKNSFVIPDTNGSMLRLPGLSTMVTRKPHLLNGVMRAIVSGQAVYGHGVGSGKTFLAIVAMHELQRIGLMKKGVVVIKKPTVAQFRVSIERAYPGSRVLMPTKKDFEPANRKKLAARIASGRFDFIILTHEQFKAIRTSEESVKSFFNDQISQLRIILTTMGAARAEDAKSTRGMDPAVRNIVKKIKTLKKRLDKHVSAVSKNQDVGMAWENLGVDGLWIDESHNFKKMPIPTQMDNVKGIPSDFSQRAVDLLIKIRDVQRRTNGRNVFFASGTPVSNTLAELWVMFHATNPGLLKQFGIETFDSFATAYADTISNFELGWDNKFKDVTRMARFKNGGSLTMLTRLGMDVRIGNKELGLDVPDIEGGRPRVVVMKPTKAFDQWLTMLDDVSSTWDTLDPKGRFENSWIPIATMRAGVAAALDPRCVFPNAPDDPNSKVNTAIRDIFAEWQHGKANKTTMMVFADMYRTLNTDKINAFLGRTPAGPETIEVEDPEIPEEKTDAEVDSDENGTGDAEAFEKTAVGGFNLYHDIRSKLINMGVPESEIAVITDHDSDVKREALFNKVRAGSVRVLIGSTEKIGEGVDVPQRMSAQFHLDPPMQMTPAKMEQRLGRIIRQGNLHSPKNWNLPVRIHLYAQERSMDAAIYQMLETKGIMVIQAMKGQYLGDEFEDPASELTMAMAEMKAAATGDTRVLELAKLQKEVRELSLEEGAFYRRVSELKSNVERQSDRADSQKTEAEKYTLLGETVAKEVADKDTMVVSHKGKRYVGEKAIDDFLERMRPALEDAIKEKSSKAEISLTLGAKVHILVEGKNVAISFDGKVFEKQYTATYWLGGDLTWGVPRWDSKINSLESILTVAKQIPAYANARAEKAVAESAAADKLGKAYAEQFKSTTFDKLPVLKEKRERLTELEGELRSEGRRKGKKQTPFDVLAAEAQTQAPPLQVRIENEMAPLVEHMQKLHDDHDRALARMGLTQTGSAEQKRSKAELDDLNDQIDVIDTRLKDLGRRLAVVQKARLGTANIDLPYGRTQSRLPGISYSLQPTPADIGNEVVVQGMKALAELLNDPRSGLSPEAARVALDMLNTPVMQNLDWSQLTVALANRVGGNYAGQADVSNWLIQLSKRASPSTFPHEVFHFLYELLPKSDRIRVDNARLDAIKDQIDRFGSKMPAEAIAMVRRILAGPVTSDEFAAELDRLRTDNPVAAEWLASLYPLSTPSEFLAGMAGNQFASESFSARNQGWFKRFLDRVKGWLKGILDALRRARGIAPDIQQIIRELIAGKYTGTPETGAQSERDIQASIEGSDVAARQAAERQAAIEQGTKEKWIPTQVLGTEDYVRGRAQITPDSRAASVSHAKAILDQAGIPATIRMVPDDTGLPTKVWIFNDTGSDLNLEGQKLLEILKREIATKNDPEKAGDLLANILNTVVVNFKVPESGMTNMDRPLREELYQVAQADRSQRGLALGALAGFKPDIQFVAQNVDVVLNRIYSDAFGGDDISGVMKRIMEAFRDWFTDDEIRNALRSKPELADMVEKLIAANRRDEGGAVYRKAQALLKPKGKKKLSMLEADARVQEAVDQIIENLKTQGIEPKPSPNKKLSPLDRLLLMVAPETADKIDKAISKAIEDAERNAGIKATLMAAGSDAERSELKTAFAEGADPEPEMVEAGLNTPEFEHWKVLKDNLLRYDPSTLKLAQDLLRSDFRGTRLGKPEQRPADTRVNLEALAKQPDAEISRVLSAYQDNLAANMNLSNAEDETQQRVLSMVEKEITAQIEAVRQRLRDPMFAESKVKGTIPTPAQQMAKMINLGLFRDPKLDIPGMIARVATKSRITKLLPAMDDLIKQVLSTPVYRQDDLRARFAEQLVNKFGIADSQAEAAANVFMQAFADKFQIATQTARKQAQEALTPKEARKFGPKTASWQKIEHAVNSGLFDTGTVLRNIARANGWTLATDDVVAQMKALALQEQKMREMTKAEVERAGDSPSALDRARREKEAATLEKRVVIKKKLEAMWAKLTRPISINPLRPGALYANRRNLAAAVNEFTSANMLLKLGFAPRQLIQVLTQGAVHTPTRAVAAAIERAQNDKAAGRPVKLWTDVSESLADAYKQRLAATKSALYATRAALAGRGEARNVDRLMSGIAAIERISSEADDLAAKGEHGKAFVLRAVSLIKLGYRVAQALDNLHGVPAEYQEMRQQVVTELRDNGQSRLEADAAADVIMGSMNTEWISAISTVQQIFDSNGITATPTEVREAAWQVVKARQYERMRDAKLPADDFEEHNRLLRSTIGWNEQETTGLGGVVANTIKGISKLGEQAGIPLPIARFGNAIGITINRALHFTPLGSILGGGMSKESPWFKTEQDQRQRKVEMSSGTLVGGILLALAAAGWITVRLRWPRDKEERDLFEREGHRPGTVEINLGDGKFIPISMNTGPMSYVAPYLAAGGAIHDLATQREKAQAKLDAQSTRTGLPAGKVKPLSVADFAAVGAAAAQGAIMGGRTAAGLIGSLTDYGTPNPSKILASQVAPLVPGLPALQEISRMAGVTLDYNLATFWDFMLPLPTSGARRVNMLGDPAGTPDDLQRIVQVLTAGTYPGVVDPNDTHSQSAYQALFASGYRPPSINPNKGYQIGDTVRPLDDEELSKYTVARGQYLKEELSGLGATTDVAAVKAAYQRANTRALSDVGVTQQEPAGAGGTGGAGPASRGSGRSAGPVSRGSSLRPGGGLATRGSSFRSRGRRGRGFSGRTARRGPSLRAGSGLRASSRRSVGSFLRRRR